MSHFAHFTTAHLCPLGPRDRMNCSETECSNHTWVYFWASPWHCQNLHTCPVATTSSQCFHLVLIGHATLVSYGSIYFGGSPRVPCNPFVSTCSCRCGTTAGGHWWPTSIGDRNSLRGKYYPNLLIRHKGSQRIYVSLNRWVVNSAAPGNSLARSGLSVATVL
jgi:hypothetical protein